MKEMERDKDEERGENRGRTKIHRMKSKREEKGKGR